MEKMNKMLVVVLVFGMILSMGCVGEPAPQYKTIEHSEPIYEYTHILHGLIVYKEVYEQTSESVYILRESKTTVDTMSSMDYSDENWDYLKQYMSCGEPTDVEAINYNHGYGSDKVYNCDTNRVGIDKIVVTLQWDELWNEDQTVYKINTIKTITVARHNEITGYNTWTEKIRVN